MAYNDDPYRTDPDPTYPGGVPAGAIGQPQNWWDGPPPSGFTGQWPPALPPGSSYGPNFGQIIFGPEGGPPREAPNPADWGQPPAPAPFEPPSQSAGGYAPPTGGISSGGGGGTGYNAPWQPPQGSGGTSYLPNTPQFNPPGYTKPAPFSYQDFVAPTGAEVLSDPGYAFRRDQGQQQLMNNKAASGVLNTGGTLKDFINYNQNFATQEYGNVWDRKANAYQMNRGGAADAYRINYDSQFVDPFKFSYQAELDKFAPEMQAWQTKAQAGQRQSELDQSYSWQQYLEDDRRRRDDRDFGANRSDTGFNQRYQVATG